MRIAVIGAGAIGCLVAGYLKDKGQEVTLVGRAQAVKAIKENGLSISGARGNFKVQINISDTLDYVPDLAILAVKTQDIDTFLRENSSRLVNSLLLTTQNGVQADKLAAKYLPGKNIISSIVMFGATCLESGKVVHNFEGSWIIGSVFGELPENTCEEISVLLKPVARVLCTKQMMAMKYLKVFVNANNCIPAILGVSMQEAFSDAAVSRIAMGVWKEGLGIINRLKLELVSLPDFPLERLTGLAALPLAESAQIYSGIMAKLSQEPLYGSILQSIQRRKKSEIDYINGEFVALAKENNFVAPLNEKLTAMVHEVENSGKFFSKSELFSRVKGLVN